MSAYFVFGYVGLTASALICRSCAANRPSATSAAATAKATADVDIEGLINQLPKTSEIGFGYSAEFSGSQFLPYPDSGEVDTLVLGSSSPTKSDTLEAIVRIGLPAVPLLLKHMDDARTTKIPPIQGMEWVQSPDEYDFNHRTRVDPPMGVNRDDDIPGPGSSGHTITVGDLCFVALGQIVNRNFNATRYQPSGGLMINSPTSSKVLCDQVRADFKDLTVEKHRQLLLQDLATPDFEERRIGAYLRLSFYYPEDVETPVLKQLSVPSYDVFKVEPFVREQLYGAANLSSQTEEYDAFVKANGPASSDGIRVELFDDLEYGDWLQPYEARIALIQLYGYKPDVKGQDRPFANTWESGEEARFIDALVHTKSARIDAAIHDILLHAGDKDYLAIACIHRLAGKGRDDELRDYCRERIALHNSYEKDFRDVLASLGSGAKNGGDGSK